MRGYLVAAAGLLLAAFGAHAGLEQGAWAQSPEAVEATIRAAAADQGADATQLMRVAECESLTPRRRLDPYAVGAAGEQGLYQLHAQGLRPLFFQRGFTDVWDATQQATFAAWAFAHGLASHWSCK